MGLYSNDNFNSHAHVERDPNNYTDKIDLNISTHTLTWSVTWEDFDFTLNKLNFNSHAHVERDLVKNVHSPKSIISTHTLTWSVTI